VSLELQIDPNELAEKLTGRDYLSWSSLSTFQACPLKWSYRYLLNIPESTVSSAFVFGGAFHRAVEYHYRELLAGNSAPSTDRLLDEYRAAWLDRDPSTIQFGKSEDQSSLAALAERMIKAFQQSPVANPAGRILGVEETLRGQVSAECPDLLARIDLLVDEGDALVVTDFKTSRSRWTTQQAEASGEQLLLYSELAKHLLPSKPLRLQFVIATKTKSPIVESLPVKISAARIARTKLTMQRIWKAIQYGTVYPAPSMIHCAGCPFREPWQQWCG